MSNTTNTVSSRNWQQKLEEMCCEARIPLPVYQLMSERRGGRTAWSCTVTFSGHSFNARFWFDGNNTNNAKEDAAELAVQHLTRFYPSMRS
ncbi:hypothetical protein K3495_g265 [Podosphaera aphanis]|nr:hypothetical protein K3495_g265 [Podosphaera aphanis]